MKERTALWLRRSRGDLRVAQLSLDEGLIDPCLFHCQQALEKCLKAMLIEKSPSSTAPKIHDLVALSEMLQLTLSDEDADLLRVLTDDYLVTRYGDEELDSNMDTQGILDSTQRVVGWLEQQLS